MHQCVRCSKLYEEKSPEVISGCPCGSKMFFFIKKEKLEKLRQMAAELSDNDKEQIEEDIREIIGEESSEPVVLDLETVRIPQPGKYEIDLVQLFHGQPVIYKLDEGRYFIDLVKSFALKK